MTSTIKIEPFSKKKVLLRLEDPSKRNRWDKALVKIGASWIDSDREPGWLLPKEDLELFDEVVHNYGSRNKRSSKGKGSRNNFDRRTSSDDEDRERKGSRFRTRSSAASKESFGNDRYKGKNSREDSYSSRDSSESRYDEGEPSDSDSDDELIQQTLARRLMSESSQKEIAEEAIENSDLEDVVSSCRRMRHIYSVLKDLNKRVKFLEEIVSKIPPAESDNLRP